MKKYTDEQLALIIKSIIDEKYSNPNFLYSQLKQNINRKIKSLLKRDLTINELEEQGLKVSNGVVNSLSKIKVEYIKRKLSLEITKKSNNEGIDISEYREYFLTSAKERVKELLDYQYQKLKKEIKRRK